MIVFLRRVVDDYRLKELPKMPLKYDIYKLMKKYNLFIYYLDQNEVLFNRLYF